MQQIACAVSPGIPAKIKEKKNCQQVKNLELELRIDKLFDMELQFAAKLTNKPWQPILGHSSCQLHIPGMNKKRTT